MCVPLTSSVLIIKHKHIDPCPNHNSKAKKTFPFREVRLGDPKWKLSPV